MDFLRSMAFFLPPGLYGLLIPNRTLTHTPLFFSHPSERDEVVVQSVTRSLPQIGVALWS